MRMRLSNIKNKVSKLSTWIMSKRLKRDLDPENTEHSRSMTSIVSSMKDVHSKGRQLCSSSITYLQPPTKSESDVKDYSVIKLPNGLTALLISDKSQLLNIDECQESESDSDSAVSDSESSNYDSDDNNRTSEDDQLSENKNASLEKLAACALCIGVGSFSDPENIPGLAHFLEHMIFMGSEKYPKENEFDVYIKKKGGSDNASTECEYTTFYFDCHETHLFDAMDIFANLFISPLMKRDSMTKEREAIESEFQMNLPSDECRKSQLLCSLADDSNPAHKFLWGNLKTLRDKIKDDDLYKSVHEFRERHYSAHRMTIAVQARLPLETLEKHVVECFKEIPNNDLPQDAFHLTVPPFKQEFSRLYFVEPVKNINHLDLTWVLPSTLKLYKSKPLNHISWVIGHEGKGSIISYLRKKLWAFSIAASSGGDGTEENSIYSFFTITLILTLEGVNHIQEILNSVFSYIKMFQDEGPQERLFQEMQLIAETSFRFSEEVPSSDNVEQLAENMLFYPSTDYITGMELFFDYDPSLIKSFLNELRSDNVNIMISSKDLAITKKLDEIEPWFGTKFKCEEIPVSWLKEWQDLRIELDQYQFHLPEPNPYISSNFAILPKPDLSEEFPKNILKDDILESWYKQDTVFKLPYAFCCFHLVSPLPHMTAQNAAMLDLFISILKQELSENLYPANVAQLEYGLHTGEKGLVITVNGYNEKINLLLKAVVEGIVALSKNLKPDMLDTMKEEQRRGYKNASTKTDFLARDLRMSILVEKHWTALQKEEALREVSSELLQTFISEYLANLFIQCLIQGNISQEVAIELSLIVKNGLSCQPVLSEIIPDIRVHQLPFGEKFCVVQSLNPNDPNSVVTNYYQSGLGSIKESCIIEMLIMLMDEPLFDSLRTKQQLGYDVSCSLRDTFGVLGFSVSVHCQSDRNSSESVEKCITEFLRDFLQNLKNTSVDDYEEVQESLIKLKKCADIHLKQEVKRNWDEIKNKEYVFDRHHREREFIEKLTLEEVIEWFELTAGIHSPHKLKKLSTQVVGNISNDNSDCLASKSDGKETNICSHQELKFLPQQETTDKFIFNLEDFRDTLTFYPAHKIM